MCAKELRTWARDALRGNWAVAVLVSLVGGLLSGGVDLISQFSDSSASDADISSMLNWLPRDVWAMLLTITFVSMLVSIVLSGAVAMGMCSYNLNLLFRRQGRFSDLFSHFHRLWDGIRMSFILALFTMLWTLLFIIPGIIAIYRYAMVPYLMAEFPELKVMDAMRESKRLMRGNKLRLFCLHFSFIGWQLLAVLTLGIGYLFVTPYYRTAEAAFYLDVTGRGQLREEAPMIPQGPEF